ncbi:MAG: diphthine--ammonia ligase [Candidatus Omnitrophota bacterium]|nr:MAG: diphthine--ammonia ligase [Candidatus Omnitrophota bacterium]
MGKIKAFCSWSGGKESAFSCYKIMQRQDVDVSYLLNMISRDGKYSRAHGIGANLLKSQAEAIGIPIVQKRTTWNTYEKALKETISYFKKENIRAGVFGDIDLQQHRDWTEKVCRESGISAILPLWKMEREKILRDFINYGFEATIVAVRSDILGEKWLGRRINEEFIKDLKKLTKVDICGESGEYHTFITNGPIFKKKIKILKTKNVYREKKWFLDILDYEVI